MQILRASTPLLAIVISSAFSLTAQTRHYRMELSSGTSGYVILENDSQSSIEAFHVKGQCGSAGMEATSDILEGPNGRFPNVAADTRSQRGGIHRWERVSFANVTFIAQPQPCTWKVEMNAVIFSDGSYEGDDAQVKALQAERDGIAASINYWAARMKTPPTTPAELDLIEADAKTQSQNDSASGQPGRCLASAATCAYWQGRDQVDRNVAGIIEQSKDKSDLRYTLPIEFIKSWQKTIDSDLSLKKMDAVFPLPADLAGQAPRIPLAQK